MTSVLGALYLHHPSSKHVPHLTVVNVLQEGVEAPPEEEGLLDGGIEEDFDVFGAAPGLEGDTELSPSSPPDLPNPGSLVGPQQVQDLELKTSQLSIAELCQVCLAINSRPVKCCLYKFPQNMSPSAPSAEFFVFHQHVDAIDSLGDELCQRPSPPPIHLRTPEVETPAPGSFTVEQALTRDVLN